MATRVTTETGGKPGSESRRCPDACLVPVWGSARTEAQRREGAWPRGEAAAGEWTPVKGVGGRGTRHRKGAGDPGRRSPLGLTSAREFGPHPRGRGPGSSSRPWAPEVRNGLYDKVFHETGAGGPGVSPRRIRQVPYAAGFSPENQDGAGAAGWGRGRGTGRGGGQRAGAEAVVPCLDT